MRAAGGGAPDDALACANGSGSPAWTTSKSPSSELYASSNASSGRKSGGAGADGPSAAEEDLAKPGEGADREEPIRPPPDSRDRFEDLPATLCGPDAMSAGRR